MGFCSAKLANHVSFGWKTNTKECFHPVQVNIHEANHVQAIWERIRSSRAVSKKLNRFQSGWSHADGVLHGDRANLRHGEKTERRRQSPVGPQRSQKVETLDLEISRGPDHLQLMISKKHMVYHQEEHPHTPPPCSPLSVHVGQINADLTPSCCRQTHTRPSCSRAAGWDVPRRALIKALLHSILQFSVAFSFSEGVDY